MTKLFFAAGILFLAGCVGAQSAGENQTSESTEATENSKAAQAPRTAQSDAGTADQGGTEVAESTEPDAQRAELPVAFSEVWIVDGTGLYYAVEEGQMFVVGVDTSTGQEKYRVNVHPLGRLRGINPRLALDPNNNFYVTGLELVDGEFVAFLGAYEVESGEELWRNTSPRDGEEPFVCGPIWVCVRNDVEQWIYSTDVGQVLGAVEVTNRRLLISRLDGFIVTVGPDTTLTDNVDFLASSDVFGLEQSWVIDGDKLKSLTGQDATPMAGWDRFDGLDNLSIGMLLGPAGPESTSVVFGFSRWSGELLWGMKGVHTCISGESARRPMIVCPADEADPNLTRRIVRLDPASGAELWAIDLQEPVDPYSFEVVLGDKAVHVWGLGDSVRSYDRATGIRLPQPGPAPCGVGGGWPDIDWPWADDTVDYRSIRHTTLCDEFEIPLPIAELLEAAAASDLAGNPGFLLGNLAPGNPDFVIDKAGRPVFLPTG